MTGILGSFVLYYINTHITDVLGSFVLYYIKTYMPGILGSFVLYHINIYDRYFGAPFYFTLDALNQFRI